MTNRSFGRTNLNGDAADLAITRNDKSEGITVVTETPEEWRFLTRTKTEASQRLA
jgi:hypothetical protein